MLYGNTIIANTLIIFMGALIAVFAGALIFFTVTDKMVKNKTFVIKDGYVPLTKPVEREKLISNLKKIRFFSLEEQEGEYVYKYRGKRDVIYAVIVKEDYDRDLIERFTAMLDLSKKKRVKHAIIVISFKSGEKVINDSLLRHIEETPMIIALADNKHMKLYLPKELNRDRYYRLFLGKAFEGMIEKK